MDCAGLEPAGHGVPEEAEALRPSIAMLPPQPRAGSVVSPALGSESAEGASAKSRSEWSASLLGCSTYAYRALAVSSRMLGIHDSATVMRNHEGASAQEDRSEEHTSELQSLRHLV